MSEAEDSRSRVLLRQQIVLAKFGELALRSTDLDSILTEACRLVGEALSTDLAKVMQLTDYGHTLVVRAGVGWKPGIVGVAAVEILDDTSEGAALKAGEPMISPDIATETRFRYAPFLIDHGVKAVANVIIRGPTDAAPFGILQVDSRLPRQFDDNDTTFLRSYANLIAAAVVRLQADTALEAKSQALVNANARLRAEARERSQIEEALRQAQKMEAVGQLTGGLAHDFNNLLTGISSNLELLRDHIGQGQTTDLDRYFISASTSITRAASLTQRLLAFSRRQTLDPKITDLNQLVCSMEELFRHTVGPSIAIETKLMKDLWLVECDPHQFESALLNLVINARDAMPDGGHLRIETMNTARPHEETQPRHIVMDDTVIGECVTLLVTDSGSGMPPHVLARAFDPFFTTKPIGKGTGLGLSMIYGFVHQSGGDVQLRSTLGEGATVTIYLPRKQDAMTVEAEVKDVPAPYAGSSGSGRVLLVVEDEEPIRTNIVEVFSSLGYTILEAAHAASGLTLLETTPQIDLLITDVGLPGMMNGCQLADAARQQRPTLKVVFITGYAENVLADRGPLEDGMQVMTKPFPVKALVARIESMLNA